MRVGALIRSYHATQYLPLILEQYSWVDKIVVLNYRFKHVEPSTDDTMKIVSKFDHPNIIFERSFGIEQHEIFNRGLDLLQDCTVAFIADADEILFKKDQNRILSALSDRRPLTGRADWVGCKLVDYNGDLYHASPERNYSTIVAVVPQAIRFNRIRSIVPNNNCIQFPDIYIHHLGLVFDPRTIEWKSRWEHKEEGHSQEKLLNDWQVRREVTPPPELVELLK